MAKIINFNQLSGLQKLGDGGQGVVYYVPRLRTSFTDKLAYKEYKTPVLAQMNPNNLKKMPQFLESLPSDEGWFLIQHSAWPCATVQKNGRCSGFVMPKIPEKFFMDIQSVKGQKTVIAELQYLLNDEEFLGRRGLSVSVKDRYTILIKIVELLAFLHKNKVAVGDLSPKNLLVDLKSLEVYLVDCDAMAINATSVLPQLETPGWEVPKQANGTRETLGTAQSDIFKFSLLALRLIVGSQDTRNIKTLDSFPHEAAFRRQIQKGMSVAPPMRGKIDDWIVILKGALAKAPSSSGKARPKTGLKKPPPPKKFPVKH